MAKQYVDKHGKIVPAGHPDAAFIHNPERTGKPTRIGGEGADKGSQETDPVLSGSVKDVVSRLADISDEELAAAFEREQSGKGRKGVTEAIQAEQEQRRDEAAQEGEAGDQGNGDADGEGEGQEGENQPGDGSDEAGDQGNG